MASGEDMAAFLCWLGVADGYAQTVKADGSIYLHIDHTAPAWVKALMDGVFDERTSEMKLYVLQDWWS